MGTSIYFTETKNFKQVRNRILEADEEYLVYIYADTKNSKLPRELIKELPIYGNSLVWINSSDLDASQVLNHMVLMIGQYINAEDAIDFYIASKTSRFDKLIELLTSQGVSASLLNPSETKEEKVVPKVKTGKRGRPKGSKNKKADTALTATTGVAATEAPEAPKKKRGRPAKKKVEAVKEVVKPAAAVKAETAPKPEKELKAKRGPGRPKKKGKPGRPKKEIKVRKTRVEKTITPELITASLEKFPTKDADVELMQKKIFSLRKVQRPKFDEKLSILIQTELAIGAAEAQSLITKLKDTGMMDNSGAASRLIYKD